MKETAIIVAPLFSLDTISDLLHKDTEPIVDILTQVLRSYDPERKRSVLLKPVPPFLGPHLATFEKTYSTDVVFEKFITTGYRPLSLPYLLGLLQKQKLVWSFFPRDIQSVEIIDPRCTLKRLNATHSVCLRRVGTQIVLSLSEYVQDGFVNASRRISPRAVRFLVEEIPEETRPYLYKDEQKSSVRKETDYERHIRLTTGMIG